MNEEVLAKPRQPGTGPSRDLTDAVLRLIWRERRISRADIARRTKLARSTVSDIVGSILPTGLVVESGPGKSSGGRRPIVLEFRDNACSILGVEMGGAHVAVTLTDLRGRVLAWEERHHPVRTDPEGTRALIIELCDAVLATRETDALPLTGIGVGVPSPIDPADTMGLSEIVLPEWGGRSGLEVLAERYDVPVLVDNDANLGAVAERWWGAGQNVDDFAYIKIATGIGSGHVIDGEIYRGATGVAGEIGHMAIDPHGGRCICGLKGCLATLVGAAALVERATDRLSDFPDSTLSGKDLTLELIERAALSGDPLALQLIREAADHLGIALAGMLNLMNPSLVIIGDGLANLGELFLEPLREAVKSRTLLSSVSAVWIQNSELGTQTVAVGASTLILKAALHDSSLFPAAAGQET